VREAGAWCPPQLEITICDLKATLKPGSSGAIPRALNVAHRASALENQFMVHRRFFVVVSLFLPVALCQNAATLRVEGITGSSATFSVSDLSKLTKQTVKTSDHGIPVTFEGVLLADMLGKVRTPSGDSFNSTVASYYLMAEADDGYKAVFSWVEIDPTFTDRRVYVVTRRDGKPLSSKDGPFELVVPGEKRNSRWVRQLKTLRVEPLPTSTAYDSEQTRWIGANLGELQSIKVGMTRGQLLKVFMEEGGISTRTWRCYVYRRCPLVKVDVEFAPASNPNSQKQSPDDRITKISKPYLERVVVD
jgi:hypothetical protein